MFRWLVTNGHDMNKRLVGIGFHLTKSKKKMGMLVKCASLRPYSQASRSPDRNLNPGAFLRSRNCTHSPLSLVLFCVGTCVTSWASLPKTYRNVTAMATLTLEMPTVPIQLYLAGIDYDKREKGKSLAWPLKCSNESFFAVAKVVSSINLEYGIII